LILIGTLHETDGHDFRRRVETIYPLRSAFNRRKLQANGSSQHAPAAEKPADHEPSVAEYEPQIRLREQDPLRNAPQAGLVGVFDVLVDPRSAVGEGREGVGVGPGRRWPRSLDGSESPVAPASLHGRPAKRERAYPEDELRHRPLGERFLADRPAAVAALTRIFIEEIERLLTEQGATPHRRSCPPVRSTRPIWPRSPSGCAAA